MWKIQAISLLRNNEALSSKHCCSGKPISVKYSECVSAALVTQHAKPMCPIILSLVCLAMQNFSTLSQKRHDFRNKVIEHKMCVLIFHTRFVWNISHFKKNSARYFHKRIQRSSCKLPVILVRLQSNLQAIFSTDFRKILKCQIVSGGWTDRQPRRN